VNGIGYLLLLAAGSWLLRLTFVVLIPPERLPARVTAALAHTAPAVLAALVSVATVQVVHADGPELRPVSVACLVSIAVVAFRRPNVALSAALGLGAALLIDLVVVR
jgi:branched-subunit amino acid transport protein